MIQRGLSAWGVHIGSFAAGWAPFVLKCFKLFHLHTGEANSYYPREPICRKGNSPNSKTGWDSGFWVPGASILDHLQPFAPFTFWKFSIFFTFILGRPILITPEGQYGGKGHSANSKTEWDSGFWVPGASILDHFEPLELKFYQKYSAPCTFILGAPFSYYPRKQKREEWDGKVKRCQQHPVFPGGLPSKY